MAGNIALLVGALAFALGMFVGALWEYARKGGTYDTEHELRQVQRWLSSRSLGHVRPYHRSAASPRTSLPPPGWPPRRKAS